MSQEDVSSEGGTATEGVGRVRRPPLERSEPRRGWENLYAPGRADDSSPARAESSPKTTSSSAATPSEAGAPSDAAARVVRDGYRIVEENLRRGRQVAAELRGAGREVADFASRMDAPRIVSSIAQSLIDPALTEQLAGVARSFLSVLSAAMPPASAASSQVEPAAEPRVPPLHPQERANYAESRARVLKLRSVGPGEWLADWEIDGQVRRVQVRAVDGDL